MFNGNKCVCVCARARSCVCARVYLEERRVLVLSVVLFGGVFPGNSEHGFLLIFPAQSRVLSAVYLRYEPFSQSHVPRPVFHITLKHNTIKSSLQLQSHLQTAVLQKHTRKLQTRYEKCAKVIKKIKILMNSQRNNFINSDM